MTRHELKEQLEHDQFADSVGKAVGYASAHRKQVIQWTAAAAIILAIVGVVLWYNAHQRAIRRADLQTALNVVDAPVGAPSEYIKTYATADERNKAAIKALAKVAAEHDGSAEGYFARYYLGTLKAQGTQPKDAEGDLKAAADSRSDAAPLAKIALAQLYMSGNRTADARGLLRQLVDKPTDLVSKAQAQILLAQLEQTSNPQEARKLLQSLKTKDQRPEITQAVDQLLSQISR